MAEPAQRLTGAALRGGARAARVSPEARAKPVYRARMEEVNKFLRDTLPQWNEKLRAWNAPTLTTRKPIDF